MRGMLARLKRLPVRRRWGIAAALLVAAFLAWFFFLRGGGPAAVVQPPPPSRPALGKVVSFGDYRNGVTGARSDAEAAGAASGDERKKAVRQTIAALENVEGASVLPAGPDAKPSQVDNTLILGELKQDNPNLQAVGSALAALDDSLGAAGSAGAQGTMSGGAALDALNKVLKDPVFDYTRNESPLQKLARWLAGTTGQADPGDTLWRWFLSIVVGLTAGSLTYLAAEMIRDRRLRLGVSALVGLIAGSLFYVATGALDVTLKVLVAGGLVVAAVAAVAILSGLNRASGPGSVQPLSELAQVLGMSAAEARKRAEESAAAGDYRSAIRYRCLAVLLALDEAGMLTFDRTATNREYLFRAPGTIHDDLQPLLDRFDRIWYGEAPTSAEEWISYNARSAAIEARVASEVRTRSRAA